MDNAVKQHIDNLQNQVDTIEDTMYVSKAEFKRMQVREHNRAYDAGELNRSINLRDIVREAVSHAERALDLPATQACLSKNR